LNFLLDHNVPSSIASVLRENKHDVLLLREIMPIDTVDESIAISCVESGRVLITFDNDFKAISKKLAVTQKYYRKYFHRVLMKCDAPSSANRIAGTISLLEDELKIALHNETSLQITISNTIIVITR